MDHLVLTVIAEDQPGLVERLAGCVANHGGNWLESRMSRMASRSRRWRTRSRNPCPVASK